MADRHIFPADISDFNTYVIIVITFLSNNHARLKISDDVILDLMILGEEWEENWKLYIAKSTCNTLIRNKKNSLRMLLEIALKDIYADIPASAYEPGDREVINVKGPAHGKGHKIKVVAYAPDMALAKNEHLQHTLKFEDPEHSESGGMPEAHTIYLERYVGEKNMKDVDIPFAKGVKVTRGIYAIQYSGSDDLVGKTAYYRSFYENASGERGPQSRILSAIIS